MKNEISIIITSTDDETCKRIIAVLSEQNDFLIAGVEKDESGTIIKSERLKPDVLILDLQPPGLGADELAPIIHRRSPSTAIIMLCDKDEENYAGLALRAGISGFLLKQADMDKLVSVVRIVSSGGCYVSASIINRVFNALLFQNQSTDYYKLDMFFTPAERGIITDIARGLSDEETAKHLNYSIGTIRNCLMAIKRKTKLKTRVQIVIFSLVHGLINIDQFGAWLSKPFEYMYGLSMEK